MKCPKCGKDRKAEDIECSYCGVIFEKIKSHVENSLEPKPESPSEPSTQPPRRTSKNNNETSLGQTTSELTPDRATSVFGGLLAGPFTAVFSAILCFIIGGLLCLTMIGAVIGVPLLIIGVFFLITVPLSPFLGSLAGWAKYDLIGNCPLCETKVRVTKNTDGVNCPGCDKRLLVKDKRLYLIDAYVQQSNLSTRYKQNDYNRITSKIKTDKQGNIFSLRRAYNDLRTPFKIGLWGCITPVVLLVVILTTYEFFTKDIPNKTQKRQQAPQQTKNILPKKTKASQHVSAITWMEAEDLVKNLQCSSGGTVDQCLNKKAQINAVEDLDWRVYPRKDGFEVERLMLLNGTMQLKYRWHVTIDGKVWVINGKAIDITKDRLLIYKD